MKKTKYILFLFLVFIGGATLVSAATPKASISLSSSTIENGGSVKATIKLNNVASWKINAKCVGATSGNTLNEVADSGTGYDGSKTYTLTCKSTSTGIINFSVSGILVSYDKNTNQTTKKEISLSKSVTVVKPREKSTNNYLSSLSVEGYTLSPAFNKEKNEYNVEVPATVTEVKIKATKEDKYASLSGTGTVSVYEGSNSFDIVVTSETGVVNTYKIIVNVVDQNPINVVVGGKNYTVIKKRDNLVAPNSYQESTVTIEGIEIPAYYSDTTKFTLVGLKDANGVVEYFIYKDGKYEKYYELTNKDVVIYPLEATEIPKGYSLSTIEINDEKVVAYASDTSSFMLIYGINVANGNKGFYQYDKEEQTFQRFVEIEENNNMLYLTIALGIVSGLLLILLILVGSNSSKKTKLIKKYEELKLKKSQKKNKE